MKVVAKVEGKIFESEKHPVTKMMEDFVYETDRRLFNSLEEYINSEENKDKHADKIYDNYSVTTHDPIIENYIRNSIDAEGRTSFGF